MRPRGTPDRGPPVPLCPDSLPFVAGRCCCSIHLPPKTSIMSSSSSSSNSNSNPNNDISKVAQACFHHKVATLCTGPASSWNMTNIVSAALEGINSGPAFTAAQLEEHQQKLEQLQSQGYHYPPCGEKPYPRIPTWKAVRFNDQNAEEFYAVGVTNGVTATNILSEY